MIRRIGAIGRAPKLAGEVAAQARQELADRRAALERERAVISGALRDQAQRVAEVVGQPDAAARLADLQDQIRAGENRLSEIGVQLAGLGGEVTEAEVAAALARFGELAAAMSTPDRVRLIELLVERVTFDRERGTVAIAFAASGFEAIMKAAA